MARARNIKPGFFTNDQLAECDMAARLLFVGLWTIADREGRLLDRPKKIKMEIFPADDVDVEGALGQLAERGFILRYRAGEHACIQVVNWEKHQHPHPREAPSTIPGPEAAAPKHDSAPPTNDRGNTKVVPEQDLGIAEPGGFPLPSSLNPDTGLPHTSSVPPRRMNAKERRRTSLLERTPSEEAVLAVLCRVRSFPPDVGDDTTEKLREYAADFSDVDLLEVAKALRDSGRDVKNGWATYRNWLKAEREKTNRAPPTRLVANGSPMPARTGNNIRRLQEAEW